MFSQTESTQPLPRQRRSLGYVVSHVRDFVRNWLRDNGDTSIAQRVAGAAFTIRLISAATVYLSQVVLARWMGGSEFGTYVYVWTWVLLLGEIANLGLQIAAQRFIPEYKASEASDLLRGFIVGVRWLVLTGAGAAALIGAALVRLCEGWLDPEQVVPLYLACLALPFFSLSIVLDGTARTYSWINLALAPHFFWRPLLILALMAAAHLAGYPADAVTVMAAVVVATVSMTAVQLVLIDRRLRSVIAPGPHRYEVKRWLGTSLPMMLVWSFYTLLTYTDVVLLQQFRPAGDVAVYYAAARTLLLVTFVYFAVGAAVTHRFSAHRLAGDRAGLVALVGNAVRWTFWPSLAATLVMLAVGKPLLWLFGPEFMAGYPLMFILAIGLLARASIGPAERLLSMLGQQRICALIYGAAFVINLTGCVVLVPMFGTVGAAIAISSAIVFETAALFTIAKRRLGLTLSVFSRPALPPERANASTQP